MLWEHYLTKYQMQRVAVVEDLDGEQRRHATNILWTKDVMTVSIHEYLGLPEQDIMTSSAAKELWGTISIFLFLQDMVTENIAYA